MYVIKTNSITLVRDKHTVNSAMRYDNSILGSSALRVSHNVSKRVESPVQMVFSSDVKNAKILPLTKALKESIKELNSEHFENHFVKEKFMSLRTKTKISNKLKQWWYAKYVRGGKIKGTTNFWFATLTLTEKVNHKLPYKMLNHFWTLLRRQFGKINFLWVAELQDGKRLKQLSDDHYTLFNSSNDEQIAKYHYEQYQKYLNAQPTDNIHFHVFFDKSMPPSLVNELWLQCHAAHGLKTISSEGKLLNPYQVEKVKSFKGVSQYIRKYITKNNTALKTMLWNCSQSISRIGIAIRKVLPDNLVTEAMLNMADTKHHIDVIVTCYVYNKTKGFIMAMLERLFLFNQFILYRAKYIKNKKQVYEQFIEFESRQAA